MTADYLQKQSASLIELGFLQNEMQRIFPEITRLIGREVDLARVGSPLAAILATYGNSDGSVQVTITVDYYSSSNQASDEYKQALKDGEKVPGRHPLDIRHHLDRGPEGADRVILGSGNTTLLGSGGKNFFTAGSGAASMTGGSGGQNTFVGGAGPGTMAAAGAKSAALLFGATSHGGTSMIQHFDFPHDKLHLVGHGTTDAPAGAQVVGRSMALNPGEGTTIRLQNFTGLNAKDFR